jgi:lysine 6-dehydrogenase
MSILVLGGCGEIGRSVCEDLVKSDAEVTVGDMREKEGQALAERLGGKASFRRVDVRNRSVLESALKGFRVVVNCIGPYFEFGLLVARAALASGTDYLDVCDDQGVTGSLLDMDASVRKEGCTFLINMGASPGLTNVMAKRGMDRLDEVDAVKVFWYEDSGETIGLGQIMHWAHIAMGKVPTYENGQWRRVQALSGREIVRFPDPCGHVPVYHLGHPEPITIPRYTKTRDALCKGGVLPESNITLTRVLDRLILVKNVTVIKAVSRFFLKLLPLLAGDTRSRGVLSAFRADVIGYRDGMRSVVSHAVVGRVAQLTAFPASIAAQMIARGQIKAKGVFPPEGCPDLNVETFIGELAQRGISLEESHEEC